MSKERDIFRLRIDIISADYYVALQRAEAAEAKLEKVGEIDAAVFRELSELRAYKADDRVRELAAAAFARGIERAALVAQSYEPRCEVCPRGVATTIRALKDDANAG